MKIAGIWSSHDCSFCILDDGIPVIHAEFERYIRLKESPGDAVKFMCENYNGYNDIKYFTTCHQISQLLQYKRSHKKLLKTARGEQIYVIGHHQAHAANAFFSSNFADALIIVLDGGGYEEGDFSTACTIWGGENNKITCIHAFPSEEVNIGSVWSRVTSYVFQLQSGYPLGNQAGTVMALAALGDPTPYSKDFYRMLTTDLHLATARAPGHKRGKVYKPGKHVHDYYDKWNRLGKEDDQTKYDLAAGFQLATERRIKEILDFALSKKPGCTHLCLAGGVALNSVAVGKIYGWYHQLKGIYVTPTPHDGGLTIGSAQYLWHDILGKPRINWKDNFTPYLGKRYGRDAVLKSLSKHGRHVEYREASDDEVIRLLDRQNIVAVFGGKSESGRRALGNRSILADPRSSEMKDKVNLKVKHRQWFRPFAPSILREDVKDWFERDVDSPYMSFVLKFRTGMAEKVPAVVHFDGSARLQTVSRADNEWYYNLLKKWHACAGVPILLNTSFNDREPICETPEHAVSCFLKTEIDYLYFYDEKILVSQR